MSIYRLNYKYIIVQEIYSNCDICIVDFRQYHDILLLYYTHIYQYDSYISLLGPAL